MRHAEIEMMVVKKSAILPDHCRTTQGSTRDRGKGGGGGENKSL